MLFALSLAAIGCADIAPPTVDLIDAVVGDAITDSVEPSRSADTTFQADLDAAVAFDVTFSEPMDLISAEEHVWLEDARGDEVPAAVHGRLEVITITPEGPLEASSNHTLVIDNGIEDSSGNKTVKIYNVNFYVGG